VGGVGFFFPLGDFLGKGTGKGEGGSPLNFFHFFCWGRFFLPLGQNEKGWGGKIVFPWFKGVRFPFPLFVKTRVPLFGVWGVSGQPRH